MALFLYSTSGPQGRRTDIHLVLVLMNDCVTHKRYNKTIQYKSKQSKANGPLLWRHWAQDEAYHNIYTKIANILLIEEELSARFNLLKTVIHRIPNNSSRNYDYTLSYLWQLTMSFRWKGSYALQIYASIVINYPRYIAILVKGADFWHAE